MSCQVKKIPSFCHKLLLSGKIMNAEKGLIDKSTNRSAVLDERQSLQEEEVSQSMLPVSIPLSLFKFSCA